METIDLLSYSIFLNHKYDDFAASIEMERYSSVAVLVDENTERDCLPYFSEWMRDRPFNIIRVKSGEEYKTVDTCKRIWSAMLAKKLDRKALLVNLGGGVIGDMGGFCAATYKRGIDFVQVPTTLLSMVDSSIGSKLGVDFGNGKNLVGVFKDPVHVWIDTRFLTTLVQRQLMSGFAETLKHALIADQHLWQDIVRNKSSSTVFTDSLRSSLMVKKRIVEADPYENNDRKALNFGHTVGHALETAALDSNFDLLHGEAVILGMMAETYLSHSLGIIDHAAMTHIVKELLAMYPRLELPIISDEVIWSHMQNDKKNENNKVLLTVLKGIGSFEINKPITRQDLSDAMIYLKKCLASRPISKLQQ